MNVQSTDLHQFSKDMISIQSPQIKSSNSNAEIFMSNTPLQNTLLSVGEFILNTHEMTEDLRTFDHQTLDAKTVMKNDFSQQSGDKSIKIGKINPIPRKSAYSMLGKGIKQDINIFSIP